MDRIQKEDGSFIRAYRTKAAAREALNAQPFTTACRARHELAPIYDRNLLGEIVNPRPIGYGYRLRSGA